MLDRYIKGNTGVQEARARQKRLEQKSSLSKKDAQALTEARLITRRHLLSRVRDAAALAGLVAIGGAGMVYKEWADVESEFNPSLAEKIRTDIREYEDTHRDQVTPETVTHLYDLTQKLYSATFGRRPAENQLLIGTESDLKRIDPNNVPEAPMGQAGNVIYEPDGRGGIKKIDKIAFIIYLGKDSARDPNVNKLSAVRAVLTHEYIHSQVHPKLIKVAETVEGELLKAVYSRGFKWVTGQPNNEPAWFFDEINTQLLAEYMNDPSGQDQIWSQMQASPLYNGKSFTPSYFPGKAIVEQIYQDLGISIKEVELAHFKSDPKKFFELMDDRIKAKGVRLEQPIALIFVGMNISKSGEQDLKKNIEDLQQIRDAVDSTR